MIHGSGACACACSIATHAPQKAAHPATKNFATALRSNLVAHIAISCEPMFRCVVSPHLATRMQTSKGHPPRLVLRQPLCP